MNKKLLYRPPKVKPSKRPRKPLPEWNSFQTDLGKYKLSSTEILKKKINAVSKNKEIAKKDWLETLSQLQTGKYITDDNDKKLKKKIDLVPRHRFQKEEKGIMLKQRPRSSAGKHFNIRNKDINEEEGNNNNDEELKMMDNEDDDIEATATKVEKNNIISEKKKGGGKGKSNAQNNTLLFAEFEETLKQMEKEIQSNNKILDNQLNEQQKQMQFDTKLSNKSENKEKVKDMSQSNKQNVVQSNKYIDKDKKRKESNLNRSDSEEEDYEQKQNELSNDNDNEEDKDNVYEIEKDIDKKCNKLNDIENCMKRLDCMLDNSKQKSMKMKYDLDFQDEDEDRNGEGYRSEQESEQVIQKGKKKSTATHQQSQIKKQQIKQLPSNTQNNSKKKNQPLDNIEKQRDGYVNEEDHFGYRPELQENKNDNIHYDNNLRDSELYLTNSKIQEQLIQKEKQIRQNLQTSPNKTNEDNDDYQSKNQSENEKNETQDEVNQARLLSIKNELLKSNKLINTDSRFVLNNPYESQYQQNSLSIDKQINDQYNYSDQLNIQEYTQYYNHLPMPKNIISPSIDNSANYKSDIQIQQPAIKKPTDFIFYSNNTTAKQETNQPSHSLSNYHESDSGKNISKLYNQAPYKINNYCNDNRGDLEDEQPYQFKPNRLNEVSSNYTTTGSQGKSIKIERNIIDITKQKVKNALNENNIFNYPGKPSTSNSNFNHKKVEDTSNDPMNYFKNLLEKTKEEIDNLTQGFDDVQPSINSYPQAKVPSNSFNQMQRRDFYNNEN